MTNADADNIINMKKTSAMTLKEISDTTGFSVSVIHRLLKKNGVECKNRRIIQFTDEQVEAIIAAYAQGIGIGGISKHLGLGCSESAVITLIKSKGIAIRNPSEQQFARMARSTPEEIAKLTAAAHAATKGSVMRESAKIARAKTMEGKTNWRSK
jgi:predicted DNA-binding transcriptional regulator AlpA